MATYKTQKLFITKEELEKLYLIDMLSLRAIAKIYNCSNTIVGRRLKLYNIKRRANTCGWVAAAEHRKIKTAPGFRHCYRCKQELPVEQFSVDVRSKLRLHRCMKCNRDSERARARALKLKAIEYLGSKCKNCGFDAHIAVFDFHHRDRSQKEKNWNNLRKRCWEKIKIELDKCDLLCANCHRIHHATEGDLHID